MGFLLAQNVTTRLARPPSFHLIADTPLTQPAGSPDRPDHELLGAPNPAASRPARRPARFARLCARVPFAGPGRDFVVPPDPHDSHLALEQGASDCGELQGQEYGTTERLFGGQLARWVRLVSLSACATSWPVVADRPLSHRCLARVFTTMSETKDPLLLWNFALAALLNGVIFAQMILYRGNTSSRRATPPSSSSRQGTLPHVAVAEKATAVKDQVVAAGVASAGQEQEHLQQQEHSTPKKNPKAAAGHAAAVTGSGGPGSAGRRYVRKLD
jgi:hypothetical protein